LEPVPPNAAVRVELSATGGVAPYQFYIQDGFIPNILLEPSGILHGTASAAGFFDFTVLAIDANSCAGQRNYTLLVGCTNIVIVPTLLPLADVGALYDVQLAAAGG